MECFSKRNIDILNGKADRDKVCDELNEFFNINRISFRFSPLHEALAIMSIQEKAKYNTIKNRVFSDAEGKGMGLVYNLETPSKKHIPFIFGMELRGGFYLKVPKDFRTNPDTYLHFLILFDYHLLVIKENRYSLPISIKTFLNFPWYHHMATSKGNLNRMQFLGKAGSVECLPLDDERGFDGNFLENIKKLDR